MTGWKPQIAIGLLAIAGVALAPVASASPARLSGSIGGLVRDAAGHGQMGAAIMLYNRYDRVVRQTLTNERGVFGFDGLIPDLYSVHVRLASFVPAMRRNIQVQAGLESVLTINLASAFSTIEVTYAAPAQGPLMSDDWKWVLRSSQATRPVLRLFPDVDYSDPRSSSSSSITSAFSDTRGMLKVSAGDPGSFGGVTDQPDLGTAFALATSVFGRNQIQVSGNLGYATRAGTPAGGIRTSFIRGEEAASSPEVTLTMRQIFLPGRGGIGGPNGQDSGPMLRTMTASFLNHAQLGDDLRLDYGMSLESVTFLERLNYLSPFARLTYELGEKGSVQLAYSSGAPPMDLIGHENAEAESSLQQDIASLAVLPRVSMAADRVRVQRTQSYEAGYERVSGNRRYSLAAFHESVNNAAVTMLAPSGYYASGDMLPDLSSDSSIFNIGHFARSGYLASVTQSLSDHLDVGIATGQAGVITAPQPTLGDAGPDSLRSALREKMRPWASLQVSGTIPATGTQIATGYGWSDPNSLVPSHFYLTQRFSPEAGWNLSVHQPLPQVSGFGRLEVTADLRNLLAQGYLPLTAANQRFLLIHAPRAVRGGLSFIF